MGKPRSKTSRQHLDVEVFYSFAKRRQETGPLGGIQPSLKRLLVFKVNDRHPFARLHAPLVDDSAERGDEPAAQARRRRKIHVVRETDEVGVGVVDRDIFRE